MPQTIAASVLAPEQATTFSFQLLSVFEEETEWLPTLAHQTMSRVGRLIPVQLLPTRNNRPLPVSLDMPLAEQDLLVIVPWGCASAPRKSGTEYLHLGFDALPRDEDQQTLTRPQPALTELLPLSVIGGWSGTSHAGMVTQVTACPGWDRQVTMAGPVGVLRHPTHVETVDNPRRTQWMQKEFCTPLLSLDAAIYVSYLARVLVLTLTAMAQTREKRRTRR